MNTGLAPTTDIDKQQSIREAQPDYVGVAVLGGVPRLLTYHVPEKFLVKKGSLVAIPMGKRTEIGVVWEIQDKQKLTFDLKKIRPITACFEIDPLSDTMHQFIEWVAHYSVSDLGTVLKMVYSVPKALEPIKQTYHYAKGTEGIGKITATRQRVLDVLAGHPTLSLSALCENAKVSPAIVRTMNQQGMLKQVEVETKADEDSSAPLQKMVKEVALNSAQQDAARQLKQRIDEGTFSATLIDGVTGSGKTEVYFAAIEHACRHEEAQVLIMLPEIILTAQLVERYTQRFGVAPDQWHSGLSPAKRVETFRRIMNGKARIVIGARSALFLPYRSLKLLIVDEEHDASYKQEEGVIYHARDMAVVRSYIESIPVVLASATPSVETVNNVNVGKYREIKLPARFNATMPDIEVVDMRKSGKQGSPWMSDRLAELITEHLALDQQVLLFLNRRGYAPLTLCRVCGHKCQCIHCSGWLVRHEHPPKLMCHICGYQIDVPKICPECQAKGSLASCGPGVQRIAEVVQQLWPSARLAVMDSDHMSQVGKSEALIGQILKKEVNVIIGTQMIAKGHHFPSLSLVGIIDADIGLSGGDLRASERCFQLLHQVSGRAGREKTQGHVLIQSYMPDNSVMQALALGDRDAFVSSELWSREVTNMPPFSRLVGVIVSGKQKDLVELTARRAVKVVPKSETIEIYGPVAAPLFIIRGHYRYRILLKSPININIQKWINQWLKSVVIPASVSIKLDIDPYQFL